MRLSGGLPCHKLDGYIVEQGDPRELVPMFQALLASPPAWMKGVPLVGRGEGGRCRHFRRPGASPRRRVSRRVSNLRWPPDPHQRWSSSNWHARLTVPIAVMISARLETLTDQPSPGGVIVSSASLKRV